MKIRTLDIDELNDRLSELEGLRDALESAKEAAESPEGDGAEKEKAVLDAEEAFGVLEQDELKTLESLKDEIGERGGKIDTDGGPFVNENDFEDYAREFAEDIGAISGKESWPLNCINWNFAADELKADYSSVEYNGTTYLYRS